LCIACVPKRGLRLLCASRACPKRVAFALCIACVPKRNMDDAMWLSVGSFAEDEACSWVKSTVLQWRDDDAGVLELVRYVGCLPLALGLASAHARVHGTRSPTEFLARSSVLCSRRSSKSGPKSSCSSTTQRLSAGL
jgi:hypothetical protein